MSKLPPAWNENANSPAVGWGMIEDESGKKSRTTLTGVSVKRHEALSTWHSPHSAHTQRFEFLKFNSITIRDRNAEDCRVAGGNVNWLDHTQTIHNHKSLKEISPFGFRSSAYLSFQFAGNTLPLLGRSRKEEKMSRSDGRHKFIIMRKRRDIGTYREEKRSDWDDSIGIFPFNSIRLHLRRSSHRIATDEAHRCPANHIVFIHKNSSLRCCAWVLEPLECGLDIGRI